MALASTLTAVEIGVSPRECGYARAGPGDKIVVDDVGIALTVTVASDVSTTTSSPVVNDLMSCLVTGMSIKYLMAHLVKLTLF